MYRTVALHSATGTQARWHVFGTETHGDGPAIQSLIYLSDDDAGPVVLTDQPLAVG